MTVKVEKIEGGIPHTTIMVAGLDRISGLHLPHLSQCADRIPSYFSFFGGLATVAALVWGSHTIKNLCSYGIGTGVPSAGMIAFGSGVIAMLFATKYGIAAPIVAVILAAIIGAHSRIRGKQCPEHANPGHDPVPRRDGHYRGSRPDGLCCHDDRFILVLMR